MGGAFACLRRILFYSCLSCLLFGYLELFQRAVCWGISSHLQHVTAALVSRRGTRDFGRLLQAGVGWRGDFVRKFVCPSCSENDPESEQRIFWGGGGGGGGCSKPQSADPGLAGCVPNTSLKENPGHEQLAVRRRPRFECSGGLAVQGLGFVGFGVGGSGFIRVQFKWVPFFKAYLHDRRR